VRLGNETVLQYISLGDRQRFLEWEQWQQLAAFTPSTTMEQQARLLDTQ
jgi:hypothetical protein